LVGKRSFVREWGRIGHPGTVETYIARGLAELALISKWTGKLKHGYR
jgi:predicted DNA-binding WGR domain protein